MDVQIIAILERVLVSDDHPNTTEIGMSLKFHGLKD